MGMTVPQNLAVPIVEWNRVCEVTNAVPSSSFFTLMFFPALSRTTLVATKSANLKAFWKLYVCCAIPAEFSEQGACLDDKEQFFFCIFLVGFSFLWSCFSEIRGYIKAGSADFLCIEPGRDFWLSGPYIAAVPTDCVTWLQS